ncbi:MAG TPA: ribonuclease H [Gemmatimonadaceae bacterium]
MSAPIAPARPLVAVYADESCLGNGREGSNPGGAAGLVEFTRANGELVQRDYWIAEPATTNNRMALRSVIEAFRALSAKGRPCDVVFTSDSQYIVKGMTDWVHGWRARGWRRKTGVIENLALWQEAVALVGEHRVEWRWVRGHAGHIQNEYANDLAVRAATTQTSSGGLVESGFAAWLAAQRERGKMTSPPLPFPTAEGFRPARALPRAAAPRPS